VFRAMTYFVAGFVLAEIYVGRWASRQPARKTGGWDWLSLLGWPALVLMWSNGGVVQTIAPFLMLALVVAAFRGRLTNRVLTNRWIATIGGMCYSIYLTHFPLIVLLGPLGRRLVLGNDGLTLLLETFVLAPIVLVVGALFFVAIERPCMDQRWPARLAAAVRGRIGRRGVAPAQVTPELVVDPTAAN
jgi:peptidoglycan/LPS O-acetylase OafA/YrhL